MAANFDPTVDVGANVHQVAGDLLGTALAALEQIDQHGLDHAVHEVRKQCKKLRALLRLVRPCDEEWFRLENLAARDTARLLAGMRDAAVAIEVTDRVRREATHLDEPLGRLRDRLPSDAAEPELTERLATCRQRLAEQQERSSNWADDARPGDLLAGWERTYRQGCDALELARTRGTTEDFHEWRKRVKDHRHQAEFLTTVDPDLAERAEALHRLSDLLGDDHDLANLAAITEDEDVLEELETRRAELQEPALKLGGDLYAPTPEEMVELLESELDLDPRLP